MTDSAKVTKITLSIGAVVAILAAVFSAGASSYRLTSHVDDPEIHETGEAKTKRIDERIDARIRLHLKPIEVKLEEMDDKIDRLLDER